MVIAIAIEKIRIEINDSFLPTFLIRRVTGIEAHAVPTTSIATGRVDSFSDGARSFPTNPPTNTTVELTDIISACAMVRSQTFFGGDFKGVKIF